MSTKLDDADENTAGQTISPTSDEPPGKEPRRALTFSVRRDVMVMSVLLMLSLAGSAWLGWMWHQSGRSERAAKSQLATSLDAASSRRQAEQAALNYAKGAAQMDYKNIPGWTKQLTANTTPELSKKLKDAAASMEQIIVPLQWTSAPTPITATTRSERDGVYVVNCFVSVITKNAQAPDGIQSTATYTVTVNKNDNWRITDVGGVDTALRAGS
ncbi:Mce-associated membrane protein [Mycobacteroides chelonae]|nr:Mce-associated membrane protein [Mycobacteroides chelonae]